MKSTKLAAILTALVLSPAFAAETDPVGFVSISVPANSDAILAVPLNRAPEFKGVIGSITGATITVSGTPGWTDNQFVYNGTTRLKTYAVQLASGAKEGLTGKVTANTANTVTLQLDSAETLTGVAAGDQVDILPYWTPSSLIPTSAVTTDSQILLLSFTAAGINQSSTGALLFDAGHWYDDNFELADNLALPFGTAYIYRNGTSATTLSLVGSVPMSKHRVILRTLAANVDQDIPIGFMSPVPTPVGSLGLNFAEDDQILIFNNSASGINKSSVAALIYTTADGWVDDNFTPVNTTYMLQPGQGYILRKKGTATPQSLVWTALPTYLQ